jgi:hypothetical protein
MSILTILLVLIAVGVILWLVKNYIPMDGKIRKIINIVVIGVTIFWLLKVLGVFAYLGQVRI